MQVEPRSPRAHQAHLPYAWPDHLTAHQPLWLNDLHACSLVLYLGFLALSVIPELRLTDQGLVDVTRFEIVPLVVP